MPNGEFAGTPVVPRTIAKYFNDTYALVKYTNKPVLYQVYTVKARAPDNIYDILENVHVRLTNTQINVRELFEKGNTVFKLTLADTWGVIVILLVGYAVSILIRVLFTNKKGLCARLPEPSIGFITPVGGSPQMQMQNNSPQMQNNSPQSDDIESQSVGGFFDT